MDFMSLWVRLHVEFSDSMIGGLLHKVIVSWVFCLSAFVSKGKYQDSTIEGSLHRVIVIWDFYPGTFLSIVLYLDSVIGGLLHRVIIIWVLCLIVSLFACWFILGLSWENCFIGLLLYVFVLVCLHVRLFGVYRRRFVSLGHIAFLSLCIGMLIYLDSMIGGLLRKVIVIYVGFSERSERIYSEEKKSIWILEK